MATKRYIPPGLRDKVAAASTQDRSATEPARAGDEADDAIPRRLSDLRFSDEHQKSLHTFDEIVQHYGGGEAHSTLHDSIQKPSQLAYVVLFRNANPRWYPDRIIFAHTNIDILPGYHDFKESLVGEQRSTTNAAIGDINNGAVDDHSGKAEQDVPNQAIKLDSASDQNGEQVATESLPAHTADSVNLAVKSDIIPIFSEVAARKGNPRKFVFHGYFRLLRVQFLKPHSPEVVRLLQQKWESNNGNPNRPPTTPRKRETAAWKKSMAEEWAVIKMTKVQDDELDGLEDPVIEVLAHEENEERKERKAIAFEKRSGADTNTDEAREVANV